MSRILFLALFASLLTACGGGGGARRSSQDDTTPPRQDVRATFLQASNEAGGQSRSAAASVTLEAPASSTPLSEPGTLSIILGTTLAALLAVRRTYRRRSSSGKPTAT